MSSQALEFVLRRDRAVILAALIVITGLAWAYVLWLANDMAMGGMDMTGFRMIPAGMGHMMPASAPWQPIEFIFDGYHSSSIHSLGIRGRALAYGD